MLMKVLNLYYSATGNTEKVAKQIENAVLKAGHDVETIRVLKTIDLDLLAYDFIFAGSGVYAWLPGKPMLELLEKLREKYAQAAITEEEWTHG
jgi:flavodoxin